MTTSVGEKIALAALNSTKKALKEIGSVAAKSASNAKSGKGKKK